MRLGEKTFASLLCAVSAVLALASPLAGADNAVVVKSYTAEEIKKMDIDQLIQLSDEINPHMYKIVDLIKRESNDNLDLTPIKALARFPIRESQRVLYRLIRTELVKAETGIPVPMKAQVIRDAIDALSVFATGQPEIMVEELRDLIEEAKGRLKEKSKEIAVDLLEQLMVQMESRPYPLLDLNDHIAESKAALAGSSERLNRMEAWMEKYYIGQPEVIQAFMDLEWRVALYGKNRTKPDAIYMIGLPGTGKDTGAEVFTDALHGYKGAHRKHMFRVPTMKGKEDIWQLLGSATGFIGSEAFPPFLAFLVQHSGGRYKIEEKANPRGEKTFYVVENPEYRGEVLEDYYAPETGVVFINEFHNWSRQLKDDVVKQALEKGLFTINNPNGGLSEIYVPIRFVIASNEGIGLVTSRESNGERHGKQLNYEKILSKWERIHENKPALKNEILATNGRRNNAPRDGGSPGVSEELLNRIPDRFILLMRPHSPENLQHIAELGLRDIAERLSEGGMLGKVTLSWTDNVTKTIQEYDYLPEENARPVAARLGTMVEDPLIDAIKEGKISGGEGNLDIDLDIRVNEDGTRSLVINAKGSGKRSRTEIEQPIRYTFKDRPIAPISDARIDELSRLEDEMKAVVFGIDPILERLAQRIVSIENETAGGGSRPVNVMMLTGLSSTGKTETAKQLSQKLTGEDDELITFDFSQIQTLHDFKVKILGLKDSEGNAIPSEFMKHYDRSNGRLIVAFDELANVRDPDLLKSLYDFFREPVVSTFADGKPRKMGGVTVIITGNAGQELYTQVPSNLPLEVQMRAWAEIYKKTANDPALQRKVLEKYYPEPLINRIGINNIFFVPPHTYKSLRELAQLKLGLALKRISDTKSRRGWDVLFADVAEYKKFIDTVIEEGFTLRAQGAAIDSFIRDDFEEPLKYLLLRFKVPSGSKVVLKYRTKTPNDDEEKPGYVYYDVFVEGQSEPIEYKIRRPFVDAPLIENETEQILTAYHEVGHSLVRQALWEDTYEPYSISIIPGVAMIANEWVFYEGLARNAQLKKLSYTRDWLIREIAILAAGETAERLASRGQNHTAGKANDIARATRLARMAILKAGLAEEWGIHAIPQGMDDAEYVASLSDAQKQKLEGLVEEIIKEGRELAQRVIEANFKNIMIPLATRLAEEGYMDKQALVEFYKNNVPVNPSRRSKLANLADAARMAWMKFKAPKTTATNTELDPALPRPAKIANIQELAEADKRALYDQVALPDVLPVLNSSSQIQPEPKELSDSQGDCEGLLAKAQ